METMRQELDSTRRELELAKSALQVRTGHTQVAEAYFARQNSELERLQNAAEEASTHLESVRLACGSYEEDDAETLLRQLLGQGLNALQLERLLELEETLKTSAEKVANEIFAKSSDTAFLAARPSVRSEQGRRTGCWQWQADDGEFVSYDSNVSLQIDDHFESCRGRTLGPEDILVVENFNVTVMILLARLEQEVLGGSGRRRKLRRSSEQSGREGAQVAQLDDGRITTPTFL
eukprot:TRINITY_DN16789_c0_g1_i5.p1 TRINITY_DN16789_c0_g1~~TRINITY_DN16789_c0_g1_i5.p1  ORF type:complete len:234 (+),score=49.07 TRINITY_DN16789_c0_g1_i5:195-896(+)